MEKIDILSYFRIYSAANELTNLRSGSHGTWVVSKGSKPGAHDLINRLDTNILGEWQLKSELDEWDRMLGNIEPNRRIDVDEKRSLQEFGRSILEKFHQETDKQTFLANRNLANYRNLPKYLGTNLRNDLFNKRLPKLAQQHFENAGECLANSAPAPALTLALQAVEVTLHYYFRRYENPDKPLSKERHTRDCPHCGNKLKANRTSPTWNNIQEYLRSPPEPNEGSLISGKLYDDLLRLRQLRNEIAHGRMHFGHGELSRDNIDLCFEVALELAKGAEQAKKKILFEVSTCWPITFDIAVALYILHRNPELPVFNAESVSYDYSNQSGGSQFIEDKNTHDRFTGDNSTLTASVTRKWCSSEEFRESIEPLQNAVDSWASNEKVVSPSEVNLASLIEGITYTKAMTEFDEGICREILDDTWDMFDTFLDEYPDGDMESWRDPNLVYIPGFREAAAAFEAKLRQDGPS